MDSLSWEKEVDEWITKDMYSVKGKSPHREYCEIMIREDKLKDKWGGVKNKLQM